MRPLKALATAVFALTLALPGLADARGSISTIRDAEIENTLERMAAPIFRAAGMPDGSIEIFIVNDKTLNAFVVGRNMAFHTGLLIELDDPEKLIGVIAHETGHIAGGHGVRFADGASASRSTAILSTIVGIATIAAGAAGGDAGNGVPTRSGIAGGGAGRGADRWVAVRQPRQSDRHGPVAGGAASVDRGLPRAWYGDGVGRDL